MSETIEECLDRLCKDRDLTGYGRDEILDVLRASPTPPTTEGEYARAFVLAQRIATAADVVSASDGASRRSAIKRLNDATGNQYAVVQIARALLSSPRVEEVRRMREALEWIAERDKFWTSAEYAGGSKYDASVLVFGIFGKAALAALSLPDGEGDKQARSPSALSAPTSNGKEGQVK